MLAKNVSLFLCFFALISGITAQCPPAQSLLPCNCSDGEGTFIPMVECGHIIDMEVLQNVFERSGDWQFSTFALYESSLMYLPASAISSKRFEQLLIVNSTLTALFDQEPDPTNKIDVISFMNVKFQRGVGWELFGTIKELKFLKAENTKIKTLGKEFVDNISPKLTNLIFLDSNTRKIQHNAFANLKELFDIEITNSEIKSLKRSMFASPSAIEEFNFSGNKMESLPDDLFTDMPHLKQVLISNNKIQIISQAVFGHVFGRLSILDLNDNPLRCDCAIRWTTLERRRPIVKGRCIEPEDLKGRCVTSLSVQEFNYCT